MASISSGAINVVVLAVLLVLAVAVVVDAIVAIVVVVVVVVAVVAMVAVEAAVVSIFDVSVVAMRALSNKHTNGTACHLLCVIRVSRLWSHIGYGGSTTVMYFWSLSHILTCTFITAPWRRQLTHRLLRKWLQLHQHHHQLKGKH